MMAISSLNYIYNGDIMTAKFFEQKRVDNTKKAKKSRIGSIING